MSLIFCLMLLTCSPTQANEPLAPDAPAQLIEAPAGFWPTEKMIDLMMRRWSHKVAERYDLNDDQRKSWADTLSERGLRFARQNRREMVPILNEMIEMRLEMTPPSVEQVKEWATRAVAAFEKLEVELTATSEELQKILDPQQRAGFEADLSGMNMGLRIAHSKLQLWQAGQFSERELWDPPGSQRRAERAKKAREDKQAELLAATSEAAEEPPDQIELELDSWQEYVEHFIGLHGLDAGQRATAHSILKELRERALAHRDRYRVEIDKLERRIEAKEGKQEDLADIQEQLTALYGPIDKMFEELKTRLEALLTDAQKASAPTRDDQGTAPIEK